MLKFIILGYVPGTSIQISFESYLMFFAGLGLVSFIGWYFVRYLARRQALRIATIRLVSL